MSSKAVNMSTLVRNSEGEKTMITGEESKKTCMPPRVEDNQAVAASHLQPTLGDGIQSRPKTRFKKMISSGSTSRPSLPPVPSPMSSEMENSKTKMESKLSLPTSNKAEDDKETPLVFLYDYFFDPSDEYKRLDVVEIHRKVKSTHKEWIKGEYKLGSEVINFLRGCILRTAPSKITIGDWECLKNVLIDRQILMEEGYRNKAMAKKEKLLAKKSLRDSGSNSSFRSGKAPHATVSNKEVASVDFDNSQFEPDIESRHNASSVNGKLATISAGIMLEKSRDEEKFSAQGNTESKETVVYKLRRKNIVQRDIQAAASGGMHPRARSRQLGCSQDDVSLPLGEDNSMDVLEDSGPGDNDDLDLAHKKHDTKQPAHLVKKAPELKFSADSDTKFPAANSSDVFKSEYQEDVTLLEEVKFEVAKLGNNKILILDSIIELDYENYVKDSDVIIPKDPDDRTEMIPPLPKPTVYNCHAPNCRLGCICDSIRECKTKVRRSHCGEPSCIFECVCPAPEAGRKKKLKRKISML